MERKDMKMMKAGVDYRLSSEEVIDAVCDYVMRTNSEIIPRQHVKLDIVTLDGKQTFTARDELTGFHIRYEMTITDEDDE
ncbi:MAG: hypothetical protein GTO00_09210 [Deltaproteobacteria bacterium]|nr:hypothetical protein [Deltaproteobacteria bacterium]